MHQVGKHHATRSENIRLAGCTRRSSSYDLDWGRIRGENGQCFESLESFLEGFPDESPGVAHSSYCHHETVSQETMRNTGAAILSLEFGNTGFC